MKLELSEKQAIMLQLLLEETIDNEDDKETADTYIYMIRQLAIHTGIPLADRI